MTEYQTQPMNVYFIDSKILVMSWNDIKVCQFTHLQIRIILRLASVICKKFFCPESIIFSVQI